MFNIYLGIFQPGSIMCGIKVLFKTKLGGGTGGGRLWGEGGGRVNIGEKSHSRYMPDTVTNHINKIVIILNSFICHKRKPHTDTNLYLFWYRSCVLQRLSSFALFS